MICVNTQDGEFTCTTCAEYANHDVLDFIENLQADKVIVKQKYKRCLAMAEWCDAEADVADADGDYDDMRWYQKWHTRWLDLANKFKAKAELKEGK